MDMEERVLRSAKMYFKHQVNIEKFKKDTFERLDKINYKRPEGEIVHKNRIKLIKKRFKNPLIAGAMISFLAFGLLLSPSVQAFIEDLFRFNQVDERTQTDIGWTWGGTAGDDSTDYSSVDDIESHFSLNVPFPEKLLVAEEDAKSKEYTVNTEDGKFVSYNYFHVTEDGIMIRVFATNVSDEKPEFFADTTKETAIEKEVSINGEPGTLIGIYDMNGYHIYFEQEDWKFINSGFADSPIEKSGVPEITEKEILEIAESVK
jgi:hypothetical protein